MIQDEDYIRMKDRIECLKDVLDMQNKICAVYNRTCIGWCPLHDDELNKCLLTLSTERMYKSLYKNME